MRASGWGLHDGISGFIKPRRDVLSPAGEDTVKRWQPTNREEESNHWVP